MLKRLFASLALFALVFMFAMAPAWHRAVTAVDKAVGFCLHVRDAVLSAIGRGVSRLAKLPGTSAPAVLLVRSRDIARRVAKRDAPRIESTWRLCPSI